MKNIKDLKECILNKTAGNLFVFNGEEWAIKKHYIDKIAEDYKAVRYVRDTVELSENIVSKGLFKKKTLYVVPHDLDFLKATSKEFENILTRAKSSTNGVVWIYSAELPKPFITHFDEYITEFEEVEEDIFQELVLHEIKLLPDHIKKLSVNCKRNYGVALLEIDKIKNYAQHEKVSNDVAFDDLYLNGILNIEKDKFSCQEFMNHFMRQDFCGLAKSIACLRETNYENVWYHLEEMVSDLKILYCFVKYGKWDGARHAYDVEHLFWGRIKEIRDVVIPWDEHNRAKCLLNWQEDDIQYLIYKLSEYDSLVKQGKMTDKEVIESLFYYYV